MSVWEKVATELWNSMKLYAAVRAMRGIALGAATGNPASALVTSHIIPSVVPQHECDSGRHGGHCTLGDMIGATLELLETPMKKDLEFEAFLLFLPLLQYYLQTGRSQIERLMRRSFSYMMSPDHKIRNALLFYQLSGLLTVVDGTIAKKRQPSAGQIVSLKTFETQSVQHP